MSEPTGQILPDGDFGQLLTRLAKAARTTVEIGTWRGGGSTTCLAMGLQRPDQRLFTVEVNPDMQAEAMTRHQDARIVWLLGSVSKEAGKDWPIVIDALPEQIDLLLIDGGEFNGRDDFLALWDRCQIIALDDTKEHKNKENRQQLIDEGWHVLADRLDERNGWAVFKRA